ncbi:hypothetical protein HH213_22040 [Duganella dendranthematis]|jgi:hypothetical protein|uniref:Uncharacterized protein n=1 Tax=Duganella dendranthematis TaxID=2728021 RepID=A0ABX6MHV0_9BURK|nr:hypothetical protein [Duganella dendranthematis]QJD92537.1 hypothetical protein HH213_22040 [Duganella dendranthematis]
MTPKHLAKIKKVLLEIQRSPQGRRTLEFEGLARALGRERDGRGKEPTWSRRRAPEFSRPLSIPAHSATVKVGTARSIVKVLLDDVAEWERYFEGGSDGDKN